ncbi:MAG: type 4a pilus biogenesis protein PilO [Candidatus Omnitrophica bacterium]|nr:type 4a pilus biogenesis protein PilO [Candidatus Omnitrophota bacterium]
MSPKFNTQQLDAAKLKEIFSDKSTLSLIGVVSITLIYLFMLFIPKVKYIFTTLNAGNKVNVNIIKTESEWAKLPQLKQKIALLNEKIDYYEKELPGQKEIPAVLKYLSDSARKLKVKITEIKPATESEVSGQETLIYYGVPISLKAECAFHQLGKFLSELESADRFIKITDIKVVDDPMKVDSHYVRLTAITYVMKK